MADFQTFKNRWYGKPCDWDGNSGNQCVDLAKAWASANGKPIIRGNAINWKQAPGYQWIANSPSNKPSIGDLVVFNVGKYGHIAIADSSNLKDLTSFDNNWPVGSNCKTVIHKNYGGVIGWLKIESSGSLNGTATVMKSVANVRSQPKLTAPLAGSKTLKKGDQFKFVAVVDGDYTAGSNKWLKSTRGNYIHSGGIKY